MNVTATLSAAQAMLPVDRIRHLRDHHSQADQMARQFEALMIQEVIKVARSATGEGWLVGEEGQSSEAIAEMGEEYLAKAIAAGGGFGLAPRIAETLRRQTGQNSPEKTGTEAVSERI